MEVMISVYGETSHVGKIFHCGDAYATIVSVDGEGLPVEVPFELTPSSEEEIARCSAAKDRSVSHGFCLGLVSWVNFRLHKLHAHSLIAA